jgi:hypothetical protein
MTAPVVVASKLLAPSQEIRAAQGLSCVGKPRSSSRTRWSSRTKAPTRTGPATRRTPSWRSTSVAGAGAVQRGHRGRPGESGGCRGSDRGAKPAADAALLSERVERSDCLTVPIDFVMDHHRRPPTRTQPGSPRRSPPGMPSAGARRACRRGRRPGPGPGRHHHFGRQRRGLAIPPVGYGRRHPLTRTAAAAAAGPGHALSHGQGAWVVLRDARSRRPLPPHCGLPRLDLGGGLLEASAGRAMAVVDPRDHCPRWRAPFWAVMRPARPCKSTRGRARRGAGQGRAAVLTL